MSTFVSPHYTYVDDDWKNQREKCQSGDESMGSYACLLAYYFLFAGNNQLEWDYVLNEMWNFSPELSLVGPIVWLQLPFMIGSIFSDNAKPNVEDLLNKKNLDEEDRLVLNHYKKVESYFQPTVYFVTQLLFGGSDLFQIDIATMAREEAASYLLWEFIFMPLLWALALGWTVIASPVYLFQAIDHILYKNSGDDG